MSLETEIATLTQATTDLLAAVNVRKASLDAMVAGATGSAAAANNSGIAAAASATSSTTSATTAMTNAAAATASATAAAASAATATTKATVADAAATAATASATISTTQATAAGASATAAAGSATSASNSATAAAASASSALNAPGTSATSTSNLTIGLGAVNLTIQTGKSLSIGQIVMIANTATPANFMTGQITAYNSGTGALTVNVTSIGGAGTFTAWTIALTAYVTSVLGEIAVTSTGTGSDALDLVRNFELGSAAYTDIEQIPPNLWPVLVSAAYQVTLDDNGKVFFVSGVTTITLPAASDVYDAGRPFSVQIKSRTGATLTIARMGADTIDSAASNKTPAANTALRFVPVSSSAWETL